MVVRSGQEQLVVDVDPEVAVASSGKASSRFEKELKGGSKWSWTCQTVTSFEYAGRQEVRPSSPKQLSRVLTEYTEFRQSCLAQAK